MRDVIIDLYEKGWILDAISLDWQEKLSKEYNVTINYCKPKKRFFGKNIDNPPTNDITLHFIYLNAVKKSQIDIAFVTHIDKLWKRLLVAYIARQGIRFICLSNQTKYLVNRICDYQVNVENFTPNSLHFQRKNSIKNKITFGIFYRIYQDDRKKEDTLKGILATLNSFHNNAKIILYGNGFSDFKNEYKDLDIDLVSETFNKSRYQKLMKKCDYVLYHPWDEGAYSILDAATLGIPVIVSDQGFHKDISLPLGSFVFNKSEDINRYISSILSAYDNSEEFSVNSTIDNLISCNSKKPNFFSYLRAIWNRY